LHSLRNDLFIKLHVFFATLYIRFDFSNSYNSDIIVTKIMTWPWQLPCQTYHTYISLSKTHYYANHSKKRM